MTTPTDPVIVNDWLFRQATGLTALSTYINEWARSKGWYDNLPPTGRNFGELIALAHSELSEAIEEWRKTGYDQPIYYHEGKPEGIVIELADTIIRILDLCGSQKWDIGSALAIKMAYNETRSYRHGGKLA